MDRAIEPILAKDCFGREYSFMLTAGALRRIVKRLREFARRDADKDAETIEGVFITVWESRVDRSETDEEAFFDRFSLFELRNVAARLQKEHQPQGNPTELESLSIERAVMTDGSGSGVSG
jgi:hypothetical protein